MYNDCLCETLSAQSRPSRSLTVLAVNRLVALMHDEGADAVLPEFTPAAVDLHYRDPLHYRDMLEYINAVEVKRISETFRNCIKFSIQIDGSVSKHVQDNTFTSCRVAMQDGNLKTFFYANAFTSREWFSWSTRSSK